MSTGASLEVAAVLGPAEEEAMEARGGNGTVSTGAGLEVVGPDPAGGPEAVREALEAVRRRRRRWRRGAAMAR